MDFEYMNKLIVFGANGMLGKYICSYFRNYSTLTIVPVTRQLYDANVDSLARLEQLFITHNVNDKTVVFNAIGAIPQNNPDQKTYIKVNAVFPHILFMLCNEYKARMFHPTTDCVFSGDKGKYTRIDSHDAASLYGITKSVGEPMCCVIRTSIIGEDDKAVSFLEWVRSNKNGSITGYVNHMWNGITCLEYAKLIHRLVKDRIFWSGVVHVASPRAVSKYELACIINEVYDLNITINKFSHSESNDKTLVGGEFSMPDIKQQIVELRNYTNKFIL